MRLILPQAHALDYTIQLTIYHAKKPLFPLLFCVILHMTGGGVRLTHGPLGLTYTFLLSHIHTDSSFDPTNESADRICFSSIGPRSLHFDITRFRDRTFYILSL